MSEPSPRHARLRLETDGAIATIIADNEPRLNAYTAAMWAELPRLLTRIEADPALRIVVVRGAGTKAFSAGADISEFDTERTGDAFKRYDDLNTVAFDALAHCAKPTIALIHGFCLGGGLEIAMCCDMRFAAEGSQYAIPAARLGIGYNPRWVKPLLAVVPAARAKEMLFTGRRFSSAEALAMGLVNAVHPAADLDAAVRATADMIAANAPLSVLAAKRSIDALFETPESVDYGKLDRLISACFESEDYAEGRAAFAAKRKPVFKGR